MLLSLPSPKKELIDELNKTFSDFLWAAKPPQFRKEIMEAEIKDGGLNSITLQFLIPPSN